MKVTTGRYYGGEKLVGKTVVVTGANSGSFLIDFVNLCEWFDESILNSTGIGLETVRDLAGRGARIIMVCRDMRKAEKVKNEIIKETGNTNITVRLLWHIVYCLWKIKPRDDFQVKNIDFESLESVRKCAEEILTEEKYVHILLNNAGAISGCFTKTKDGLDALMQTNYFGPFLFTNILLGN